MTETMTLNLKLNPELSSQTKELIALAEFYTITTAEESVEASEFLARIQKLRRWIDGIYKDAKSPLATAKRTLDSQQKALLDPLAVAERTVMQRIVDYKTLQDNQRQLLEIDARLAAGRIARAEQARQAQIVRQLADAAQTSDAAAVALHAQADMIEQSPMLVMPAPVVMDTATLSLTATLIGDLNNDGAVNAQDIATLLNNWGGAGLGDLDNSGQVDAADLSILLNAWTG